MQPENRIAKALLALASTLAVLCVALIGFIAWSRVRGVRLEELTAGQRLALVDQLQRTSPSVFRAFPFSGSPGFYQMVPNTTYENVYGASFSTNELGFRAPSRRPTGVKRLVIAGDSWTFGPFVPADQSWGGQLERMLNRQGARWQVYNLSMMGWNSGNLLAALQQLLPVLEPDLVVLCPTPNDIDESFAVWEGRLVTQGFTTQAIFRDSFLTEQRWIAALRDLQSEIERLEANGIPAFTFFLADWEGLAPYYAKLADFRARYAVQPPESLRGEYRLPGSVDPGEHATVAGHAWIAAYLHNALVDAGLLDLEPVPLEGEVEFPGQDYDPARVEEQLSVSTGGAAGAPALNLYPVDPECMLDRGLYAVTAPTGARTVRVKLRLLPDRWLYPLRVEIRLAADEPVAAVREFPQFVEDVPVVELTRPDSLRDYDFVEVLVAANRTVLHPRRGIPVSMRHPEIELAP